MANQLSANPFKLDTVGTVFAGKIKIVAVEWNEPTDQGDALILNDIDGNNIINTLAEADGQSQFRRLTPAWYNGLVLATLTSGTVLVHFA